MRCGDLMKILINPKMTFPITKRINTELVYWWEIWAFYMRGSDQELLIGFLRDRGTESWLRGQNIWEWKPIMASCSKWLTMRLQIRTCNSSLFEMILTIALVLKYCIVKLRYYGRSLEEKLSRHPPLVS